MSEGIARGAGGLPVGIPRTAGTVAEPMGGGAQVELLVSYLNAQRAHVLGILDGLDDADLRRRVLPTGWSCLGLVQHLTVDVERWWFRAVMAAEPDVVAGFEASADDAWQVDDDVAAAGVLGTYRDEIARSDAYITSTPLDTRPAWWPGGEVSNLPVQNLQHTILHVITETACHAGHLDAVRELIDGRTWLVLT